MSNWLFENYTMLTYSLDNVVEHYNIKTLEPNISFELVPRPKPHPSAATYAHPCPPMLFKLRPYIQNYNTTNNLAPMPTQNP